MQIGIIRIISDVEVSRVGRIVGEVVLRRSIDSAVEETARRSGTKSQVRGRER
jgi:hypothetical protein